jgi:phosphoserine phosphatase RsbU/P
VSALLSSLGRGAVLAGSRLTLPLWREDQLLALVELRNVDAAAFTPEDRSFAETLALSLATSIDNINFTAAVEEKARMELELTTAAAVQRALLPRQMPDVPGAALGARFVSASETGGDYYGFMTHFPGRLFVLLGDATGHGTPAALVVAAVSAACRLMERLWREHGAIAGAAPSPRAILQFLNRTVYEAGYPDYNMTFVVACLDLTTGRVSYANAGHYQPLSVGGPTGEVAVLAEVGTPLGLAPECDFQEAEVQLAPGDLLFLFTDGLVDRRQGQGDAFGHRRLTRFLREHAAQEPAALVELLVGDTHAFAEGAPLADDLTAIACRFVGTAAAAATTR